MFRYTYKGTADYLLVKVETININEDWQYLENNTIDFEQAMNSTKLEDIYLPHVWNKLDAVEMEPEYRRAASWYKKSIEIDKDPDAFYKLYFEGINTTSSIYVNGDLAYTHIGGYVGFEIDITPYVLKENPSIEISVRVDNSCN
jgi:beta-galactosidase